MGGHGGLNILPQKSWNVYGRRNRLKVYEDEEKHRQEQEAANSKREQAEREFRLDVLRKRSINKDSVVEPKIEHINLFKEEEFLSGDSEIKKERELQDRKRGRKEDRTSDAKFDERFAFGYGVKDSKPWYARPAMRFTESNETEKDKKEKDHKIKKKSKTKKKLAKELLKEMKKANFKKSDVDEAMLRIERLRREKKEKKIAKELKANKPTPL